MSLSSGTFSLSEFEISLYLCRASQQMCNYLACPAKKVSRRMSMFQDTVDMVPFSVTEAAGEDNPSGNKEWTGHV